MGCSGPRTPGGDHRRAASSRERITVVDASDTASYAAAGPEAVDAVDRCHPPACRPDIFRGPAPGELTVGLDSAAHPGAEHQWHIVPELAPGRQAFQDSSWAAMLTRWEAAKPSPLLLIDGAPASYADARKHFPLSSVAGVREVNAKEAMTLTTDPRAANGAIVITTKAHGY